MTLENTQLLCEVYRCSKKEGMYVYVEKSQNEGDVIDTLPDSLKQTSGRMELAMTLILTPDKKLARANASDVINAVRDQGFYLQMPPVMSAEAQATSNAINEANNKLER